MGKVPHSFAIAFISGHPWADVLRCGSPSVPPPGCHEGEGFEMRVQHQIS